MAACLMLALPAGEVRANGRAPATLSIALGPGTPPPLLVSTTFGGMLAPSEAGPWGWICEEALGVPTTVPIDVTFAWLSAGPLVAATGRGLLVSHDGGCTFKPHPTFIGRTPVTLAYDATVSEDLYVVVGNTVSSALYVSRDGAASFTPLLQRDAIYFSTVAFSRSQPTTLYVGGWDSSVFEGFVWRSADGGLTWSQRSVPLPNPGTLALLGVSPTHPATLFWGATDLFTGTTRLYRSTDRGDTAQVMLHIDEPMHQLAIAPDGRTLWLATASGILRSDDGGDSFTRLGAPHGGACVMWRDSVLYACSPGIHDPWAVAQSTDNGDTWEPIMVLKNLQGVLACDASSSTAAQCGRAWPTLAQKVQATPGSSATLPPSDLGCNCRETSASGVLLGMALVGWQCRRRRRREAA